MFYGMVISGPKAKQIVPKESQLLHLSNVAWKAGKSGHSVSLYAKKNHTKFLLCVLTKQNPQTGIDVYVHQQEEVALQMEGNGEIHVTGYYEPSGFEERTEPVKSTVVSQKSSAPLKRVKTEKSKVVKKVVKVVPVEKKVQEESEVEEEIEEEVEEIVEEIEEEGDDLEGLEDLEELEESGDELDEEDIMPQKPNMTNSKAKKQVLDKRASPDDDLDGLDDLEGLDDEEIDDLIEETGEIENDIEDLEDEPVKQVKKKVVKKKIVKKVNGNQNSNNNSKFKKKQGNQNKGGSFKGKKKFNKGIPNVNKKFNNKNKRNKFVKRK